MKRIYFIFSILVVLVLSSCEYYTYNSLDYAIDETFNYSYEFIYEDGSKQLYYYNDGNIKTKINKEGIESLIYIKKDNTIIKTISTGINVLVESNSLEFDELKNKYFKTVLLKEINSSDFVENGNYYSLKTPSMDSVCNKVFDNTLELEFTSFVVRIFAGKVYEIKCSYLEDDVEKSFKIQFYSVNETSFDIPTDFGEASITNIIPSKKLIKVKNGTTLMDALAGLYISVVYEDGTIDEYNIESVTYRCDNYNPSVKGSYVVEIVILNNVVNVTIEVEESSYFIPSNIETLNKYADNNNLTYGMPSTGNSKALVIPVEFTDYKAPANMKENLEKAFFGTSDDTGWESLSSYYYKSSYGKLHISGTVLDVYSAGNTSSYYNKKYERGEDADYLIIKSALEYYDNQIDYSEFDSNNDGYIDALYIAYTTPIDYDSDTSMWWAFTYEYFTDDYEYYDGVEADYYCFFGYDFLFEEPVSGKTLKLNSETIIHETGHILGLDDYYDYDDTKGPDGGIGGGDMMDYNVGDHNPFSKLLMGWVTPYVVCDTSDITLNSFGKSGECILLVDEYSSIYDEYYLIDFYTPDGLNELEAGNNGLFSISGIRIYHVDARITKNDAESILDIYDYDNSYTNHRLISLVQTSGKNTIEQGEFSSNQDLLKFNQEYTISSWYSNTNIKFVISAVLNEDLTVDVKIIKK